MHLAIVAVLPCDSLSPAKMLNAKAQRHKKNKTERYKKQITPRPYLYIITSLRLCAFAPLRYVVLGVFALIFSNTP